MLPNSGGTGYLGNRGASTVALSSANRNVSGSWVATFLAEDMPPEDYEVYHISVRGPSGNFDVYVDDIFYSTAVRSDRNEYDPRNPMFVRRGQTITFHFSSASSPTPVVNMFLRQPQQGIF